MLSNADEDSSKFVNGFTERKKSNYKNRQDISKSYGR